MNKLRIILGVGLLLILIAILLTILANRIISKKSRDFITEDISQLNKQKTGLLLGTSRYLSNGRENPYFFHRIDAAVELYHSGKIDFIIASGDNSRKGYSEPEDMKEELMKRGIPEEKIFLDYAGFRTLDSVLRARAIFGQDAFIVISQRFHNERAVYIARRHGIEAYGYNAGDVHLHNDKTRLRELLARVKVFWDLFFNVKPKFYGEPVTIE